MSAFETGERKNIPAVLIYVFSYDVDGNERVLMIHRDSKERPGDFHAGKWNGLGGKCEADESYRDAAARELFEESGLRIAPDAFDFSGFLHFPNFKPKKSEDWSCMVFRAQIDEKVARAVETATPEGTLHWVLSEKILELNLWDGDREFIPAMLNRQAFVGTTWYADGKASRSEITLISSPV